MSVVNRTLDPSEQRKVIAFNYGLVVTGATLPLALVPYQGTLDAIQIASFGQSNSPTGTVFLNRFIVGSGFTTWAVTGTYTPPEMGTSGILASGMSLLASGSTLLNVLPGDMISYTSAGSNAALKALAGGVVIRPLQDVKVAFGLV